MVYFQTRNFNLGIFWSALKLKMSVDFVECWEYCAAILYMLWPFSIFCDSLVFFPVFVYCAKKNLATMSNAYVMKKFVQNLKKSQFRFS
jgi:hypothetical protein